MAPLWDIFSLLHTVVVFLEEKSIFHLSYVYPWFHRSCHELFKIGFTLGSANPALRNSCRLDRFRKSEIFCETHIDFELFKLAGELDLSYVLQALNYIVC